MAKTLEKSLICSFVIVIGTLALAPWSQGLKHSLKQPSSLAPTATVVAYHGGPLLTRPSGINVYLIWYGAFSLRDRTTITDFFASFSPPRGLVPYHEPSVSTWWKTVSSYKDKAHNPVSSIVRLFEQVGDAYSLGKNLKRAQIDNLVRNNIIGNKLPTDSNGIYLVLTAKDVIVEKFCMDSCGFHDSTAVIVKGRVVYAHVGDSVQCPSLCAWPYAVPAYGPPGQAALVAPNGVGADGMVINIATILAGAATNPYKSGYFQGDVLAPLEAASACPGIFGAGAYPGYPGNLLVDSFSKASYNAYGANGKKFLVPAIWDLASLTCKVV